MQRMQEFQLVLWTCSNSFLLDLSTTLCERCGKTDWLFWILNFNLSWSIPTHRAEWLLLSRLFNVYCGKGMADWNWSRVCLVLVASVAFWRLVLSENGIPVENRASRLTHNGSVYKQTQLLYWHFSHLIDRIRDLLNNIMCLLFWKEFFLYWVCLFVSNLVNIQTVECQLDSFHFGYTTLVSYIDDYHLTFSSIGAMGSTLVQVVLIGLGGKYVNGSSVC